MCTNNENFKFKIINTIVFTLASEKRNRERNETEKDLIKCVLVVYADSEKQTQY